MSTHEDDFQSNAPVAGLALALSAIASIAAVALDSMATGTDPLSIMQSMVKIQQAHQIVHVITLACVTGLMFGHATLAQRLGLRRAPVMAGLVAYGLGAALMMVAGVIDGFVSTDIAAMFVVKPPEVMNIGFRVMQVLENVFLIDLAKISWVLQSLAVVLWSIALLRDRGFRRIVGSIGLVVGAAPAVIVFVIGSNMSGEVVLGILLAQAIWNLSAATLLLRNDPYVAVSAN